MDLKKKVLKKEEIEYLGNLAKIGLTEDEKAQFAEELDKIIYYISQLSEVPTEKVSPVWHVLPVTNVFRKDEVKNSTEREKLLENAPEKTDRFFKVPKIIK
jgi:aspartyl-tRNA(Asn)/glutamyl-tRNA(Gln) amidotransferase subunit C